MANPNVPQDPGGQRYPWVVGLLLALTALAWAFVPPWKPALLIPADGGVAGWPVYGGDAGGTRYAPLQQITPENVMHLG